MTDTTEYEVPPKIPPDWRDWINEFPSVKSVAFFSVIAWITTALVIGAAGLWGYYTGHEPAPGIIRVLEIWLDALNWLTAAAVFGVVGKRLSEKPEVIRAEGEVKAAQVAAATAPSASTTALPAPAVVAPVTDLPDVPGEGD